MAVQSVPPGPRGREVFDFLGGGSVARTLGFLEQTARRFGPISSFRILSRRMYLVDDPELIQQILVTEQHRYARDTGATLLRELVGDGLLTRDEPSHRERRRLLQPAFHREQIASYAAHMVREAERTAREWREGSAVDIGVEMRKLTLAIAGVSLFGTDFRESAGEIAAVLRRVIRRLAWLGPVFTFIEGIPLVYRRLFPHGRSLFFPSERAELERILAPLIERRRAAGATDLLSMLLGLRDETSRPLSDEDVRNEVVTLVLAGHETTAAALTSSWFLLSCHPRVESCLHAEVDAVLGTREATLEDLGRLRYTSMVFTEAMRLYPPAPIFGRRPLETVKLAGYAVSRGTSILLSPYVTHRNARYFEHPAAFEPERWEGLTPPKFAYFPFGGGAKLCLGESFARMEGVLALASLARSWRVIATKELPAGVAPDIGVRSQSPIRMRLERRRTE